MFIEQQTDHFFHSGKYFHGSVSTFLFALLLLFLCSDIPIIAQSANLNQSVITENSLRPEWDRQIPMTFTKSKSGQTENSVSKNGTRRLVPDTYATIQAAIDASVNGDTVLVADNTYVENIRYHGKAITVASYFLLDGNADHIASTVIDGSNPTEADSASTVYFVDGEDTTSVLCGFTITGGKGTVVVQEDDLTRIGGGILAMNVAGVKIIDNVITQNRITGEWDWAIGGGVELFGDSAAYYIVERNEIAGNYVESTGGNVIGGGMDIFSKNYQFRVNKNNFVQDTVIASGVAISGGANIEGVHGLLSGIVRENQFIDNYVQADQYNGLAGGLYLYKTGVVKVIDNFFANNLVKSLQNYGEGGGLIIDDTDKPVHGLKQVSGNDFCNNDAIGMTKNGRGGGIELFNSDAHITQNLFAYDSASGSGSMGGAIRVWNGSFRLVNNVFNHNTAVYGGAVHIQGTAEKEMSFINNTIVDNTASLGAAIYGGLCNLILFNNIIWGNLSDMIYLKSDGEIDAAMYNLVQNSLIGHNNFVENPDFQDDNYNLSDTSWAVGNGKDSIEVAGIWYFSPDVDYYGSPRPDPIDNSIDIGAIESPYAQYYTDIGNLNQLNPNVYWLAQNYPNPFNPSTTISYQLPVASKVDLTIYNILGQRVWQEQIDNQTAGQHEFKVDLSKLSSGIYFYRLEAGGFVQTRKMVLLK